MIKLKKGEGANGDDCEQLVIMKCKLISQLNKIT